MDPRHVTRVGTERPLRLEELLLETTDEPYKYEPSFVRLVQQWCVFYRVFRRAVPLQNQLVNAGLKERLTTSRFMKLRCVRISGRARRLSGGDIRALLEEAVFGVSHGEVLGLLWPNWMTMDISGIQRGAKYSREHDLWGRPLARENGRRTEAREVGLELPAIVDFVQTFQ